MENVLLLVLYVEKNAFLKKIYVRISLNRGAEESNWITFGMIIQIKHRQNIFSSIWNRQFDRIVAQTQVAHTGLKSLGSYNLKTFMIQMLYI